MFSIVSPSNFELKREAADRKDSASDTNRTTANSLNMRRSNPDGTNKPPALKSSFVF
jgi:hypothetical protein